MHLLHLGFAALAWGTLAAQPADWQYHARRLTGFSEVTRTRSLQALKKLPKLEKQLASALDTPDRYLALDVVANLQLHSLVPELEKRIGSDENGAVVLALNALLTPQNIDNVVDFYDGILARSGRNAVSPPAFMAMLDLLARVHHPVPEKRLLGWMKSPDPDLRSAVIYYVRSQLVNEKKPLYPQVVDQALRDRAYLIRLQTLSALQESKVPTTPWAARLSACRRDAHPEVAKLCERFKQ